MKRDREREKRGGEREEPYMVQLTIIINTIHVTRGMRPVYTFDAA